MLVSFCLLIFFFFFFVFFFSQPIYRYFSLTPVLAWLLFIPCIDVAGERTLAEIVFWMGAPLLLFLSVGIMGYWFHQVKTKQIQHADIAAVHS